MNKIERRAYLAVYYIWQNESMQQYDSNTAYRLSQYWGCSCTPQTMTNTLMRYARKLGIEFVEIQHRPNAIKRVWQLTSDHERFGRALMALHIGEKIYNDMHKPWMDKQ